MAGTRHPAPHRKVLAPSSEGIQTGTCAPHPSRLGFGPPLSVGFPSLFPSAIEQVANCQNGMPQEHAGAGISHDLLHPIPHLGLVAMDRTTGTGRLLRPKGTAIQPAHGVVEQFGTLRAQVAPNSMMPAAIEPHHGLDGSLLSCDSRWIGGHGEGGRLGRSAGSREFYGSPGWIQPMDRPAAIVGNRQKGCAYCPEVRQGGP